MKDILFGVTIGFILGVTLLLSAMKDERASMVQEKFMMYKNKLYYLSEVHVK